MMYVFERVGLARPERSHAVNPVVPEICSCSYVYWHPGRTALLQTATESCYPRQDIPVGTTGSARDGMNRGSQAVYNLKIMEN